MSLFQPIIYLVVPRISFSCANPYGSIARYPNSFYLTNPQPYSPFLLPHPISVWRPIHYSLRSSILIQCNNMFPSSSLDPNSPIQDLKMKKKEKMNSSHTHTVIIPSRMYSIQGTLYFFFVFFLSFLFIE